MSLHVNCYVCGRELDELGALVFSPPDPEHDDRVVKRHLCIDDSITLARWLDDPDLWPEPRLDARGQR